LKHDVCRPKCGEVPSATLLKGWHAQQRGENFGLRALLACQSCTDSISPRHFSDVLCFTLPYPHQNRDVHLHLRRPTPRPLPTSTPSLCSDMHRLTQRCAPANGHSLIMLTCPSTHHRLHIVMATPTISDVPSFTVPYPHVLRAGYLHLRCPVPPPLFSTSPPSLCFDVRPCHPSSAPPHRHSLIMLTCPSTHHRLHIFMVTPTISDVPFFTVPYPHVPRAGDLHLRCPYLRFFSLLYIATTICCNVHFPVPCPPACFPSWHDDGYSSLMLHASQ
jgi:uncharacterized protein YbaR (Trm112 family)